MDSNIPNKLYFKIGEVSKITGVEPYILRYWESEFKLVKPFRTKSNQRLYRRKDVESIIKIRDMLYEDKFTIAGAKKKLKTENIPETQQLPLRFSDQDYMNALKETQKDLQELSALLSQNPNPNK